MGSRTKPVVVATRPETGSTTPSVTGRVVAGSRIVPSGIGPAQGVSFEATVLTGDQVRKIGKVGRCQGRCPFRSRTVGTDPVRMVPWTPAQSFVVAEEEDLVLDDRSAERNAELVLPKFTLWCTLWKFSN